MRESLRNPCPTQGRNSSSAHNRGGTWLPLTNESRRPRSNQHANGLNLVQPLLLFREKTRADETLISSNHDQVSPPNMHLTFYDNIDISFYCFSLLVTFIYVMLSLACASSTPQPFLKPLLLVLFEKMSLQTNLLRQSHKLWMRLSKNRKERWVSLSPLLLFFKKEIMPSRYTLKRVCTALHSSDWNLFSSVGVLPPTKYLSSKRKKGKKVDNEGKIY